MQFTDIHVDQFGVLTNTGLTALPQGLTVVYGGNGSGKTTLVSFLRGLLFGFGRDQEAFQIDDRPYGGQLTLRNDTRRYQLQRQRSQGRSLDPIITDLNHGTETQITGPNLPAWVNETVYQEIFSVGDQEASRFDLLSRLCLEDAGQSIQDGEINRTERAIQILKSERDGAGTQRGLKRHVAELQLRRDEQIADLRRLREADPRIPVRISEIERQLATLRNELREINERIEAVDSEIRQVEALLERLRRRNVVSLDRQKLENRIAELNIRREHWISIRDQIQTEVGSPQTSLTSSPSSVGRPKALEALESIRALVSRLEDRTNVLSGQRDTTAAASDSTDSAVLLRHVRDEVFSLCEYLSQHQQQVGQHVTALETMFGQQAWNDADQVIGVLQNQIDSLRSELSRSDNVVNAADGHSTYCEHTAHQSNREQTDRLDGSIPELERRLVALQKELENLQRRRSDRLDQIRRLEAELADLKSRQKPVARLADIDRLKAKIAALGTEITSTNDRIQVIDTTIAQLSRVIERLKLRRQQSVLELASQYITRLTDGDCHRLFADAAKTSILAETRQTDRALTLQQLSRGTRDQVALALRLALIQVRAEHSDRCPLVLDDVFITSDDERAAAVADLLMEVAADGQQIIFLTCQNDVRELFARRNATIRTLEEAPVVSMPMPVPVMTAPPLPERTPAPAPSVRSSDQTNWLFYLEVDHSVEDLCGLTVAELEALRVAGIDNIDQLLLQSTDEIENRLREKGYSISRERIRAWRGQAELSTQVPMLRRSDAELLYAAGIQSPVELSRLRPETLYDQVTTFQASLEGKRFLKSGRHIDRQQAINWTRWAQHARSLSDARHSRSRYFVRTTDSYNTPSDASRLARNGESGISTRRARISSRAESTTVRQRRPRLTSGDRRNRDERLARRRRRLARHSSSYRTRSTESDDRSSEARQLRFFLSRSNDVEAAPSIGPRTAQRLAKAEIYTVDDLITANPESVAATLDNRRINAETIRQWQDQARLVCQVPELRGHDAQILVACGITEPEQLAGKRPVDLMAVVGPFSNTSEGERIIRGGQKPDLEEVTEWIHHAQQSRTLTSAA